MNKIKILQKSNKNKNQQTKDMKPLNMSEK